MHRGTRAQFDVRLCVLGDGAGLQLIIEFGWKPDENSGAIELTQVHTHTLLMFSQHDHCPHFCQSETIYYHQQHVCVCEGGCVCLQRSSVFNALLHFFSYTVFSLRVSWTPFKHFYISSAKNLCFCIFNQIWSFRCCSYFRSAVQVSFLEAKSYMSNICIINRCSLKVVGR